MKHVKYFSSIFFLINCFLHSCSDCDCTENNTTQFKSCQKLGYHEKREITVDGNVKAYEKFKIPLFFKEPESVIFYSLVMALKHQNAEAYYDVYLFTSEAMEKAGVPWHDSSMQSFTLPFLYKSAELGYDQAINSNDYKNRDTIH